MRPPEVPSGNSFPGFCKAPPPAESGSDSRLRLPAYFVIAGRILARGIGMTAWRERDDLATRTVF